MKIIVGLGNPGEKYKKTRHNAGFMAVDFVVSELGLKWSLNKKFKAEIAQNHDTLYVKPTTFMNNSGESIQAIASYYKLLPKKLGLWKEKNSDLSEILTVIHDELDIAIGKYKISVNSRSAGHNGIQSIINYIKTKNFKRIRIGIRGKTIESTPVEKYVVGRFTKDEMESIKNLIKNLEI